MFRYLNGYKTYGIVSVEVKYPAHELYVIVIIGVIAMAISVFGIKTETNKPYEVPCHTPLHRIMTNFNIEIVT
jgi:hypothetical protein